MCSQVIPHVVREVTAVFEPYHGRDERGVVFNLTLEHGDAVPLDHFISRLL